MTNSKRPTEPAENDSTDVFISAAKKSRTLLGRVSDITSMFMKKKSATLPPPITAENDSDDLPTRIAHPLDRSNQMKKMDLSSKGHNFQETDVQIENEVLHSVPRPPQNQPALPKVNSRPPIARSESYTNVDFNLKKEMDNEENTKSTGLFSKIFSKKKKLDLVQDDRIQASENTQVFGRDETVVMAAPKLKNTKHNIRLAMFVTSIGILLFIGRDFWVNYQKRENELTIKTPELIDSTGISLDSGDDHKSVDLAPRNLPQNGNINYQMLGRGMVYHCQGNQWHCLDAPNYRKCRAEMRAGKKTCLTKAVLETVDMCKDEIRKQSKTRPPGC
jgi:hypothetical protein